MTPKDRLIVALDVPAIDDALALADLVGEHVGRLKVGLELFTRAGPDGVRRLGARAPIMLDLKLHDIPATVARALRAVEALHVELATIHAGGGSQMMSAAAAAAPAVKLLAVTVLTSLDTDALREVGLDTDLERLVARRAELAVSHGCAGIVASPREASHLRKLLGEGPLIVTPGIRPAGSSTGDQKRVATPRAAIEAGADLIVVGRPIRDAADPAEAARRIVDEIAAGCRR